MTKQEKADKEETHIEFFRRNAEVAHAQAQAWWKYAQFRRLIDDSHMALLEEIELIQQVGIPDDTGKV